MTQATTQKLLTNLRGAGLTLTVIKGGKLSVSPKSLLTDQIRSDIKAAMPALIECLTEHRDMATASYCDTLRPVTKLADVPVGHSTKPFAQTGIAP